VIQQKDYYHILGVSESATFDEIKKTYRTLAFQYHPDRNPDSEEKMKEINEAYAVLSNENKRKEYDALRKNYGFFARDQFRRTYSEQDIFKDSDIFSIFEELSKQFGFTGPEDIFSRDNFYGSRQRIFEFKGPGFSGRGFFYYANTGNVKQDNIYRDIPNKRKVPQIQQSLLSKVLLKGLGYFQKKAMENLGVVIPQKGRDITDEIKVDPEIADEGGKIPYYVKHLGHRREILIKIPSGVNNGQKIVLKGLGEEGKNQGEPGNLFLKIRIHTPLILRIRKFLSRG
jgi:curved DNA-binding protein